MARVPRRGLGFVNVEGRRGKREAAAAGVVLAAARGHGWSTECLFSGPFQKFATPALPYLSTRQSIIKQGSLLPAQVFAERKS